jgi:hypothetical protein
MTDEMIALARRAAACKGWRWMPGMAAQAVLADGAVEPVVGIVVGFMDILPSVWWPDLLARRVHHPTEHLIPDLTDPATLGCLLALAREAWGEPRTVVVPLSGGRWGVAIPNVLRQSPKHKGDTEAEALVAALASAP